MAPSHADSHRSRSFHASSPPNPSSRPSRPPRPTNSTHPIGNTANSNSTITPSLSVASSRISKHQRTGTERQRRETVTRSRTIENTYTENKPTSKATPHGIIVIHLNNRLGRRTAIQCSPLDTIKTFKMLASLQLGTRPETILLKRQGQRALKDGLTLEDYEIGNGCSLDLEVDTED